MMHLRFMGYMRCGFAMIALGVGFFPLAALAQLGQTPQDLSISLAPKYPGPFETVTANAVSYSFDLDRATYTWYQNGTVVSSGKGKKTISFRTGAAGSHTDLQLVAMSQSGDKFKTTLTVRIGDLTLLWSSDAYTPPGYRGKAIAAMGSTVRVIALPDFYSNGTRLNPKALYYSWEINGTPLPQSSGRGTDTLPVGIHSSGIPSKITVKVSDENERTTQQKTLELVGRESSLLFYELDPLRGPRFQSAITKEFSLTSGNEAQFLAVPLFVARSLIPNLTAMWKVEGRPVGNEALGSRPFILRYTSQAGSIATQSVSIDLRGRQNELFSLTKSFQINVR